MIVGLAIVVAIALVNFRGIGESAKVNVAFTLIELCGLLLVLLIGIAFVAGGDGDPGRAFEFKQNWDSVPFLVLAGASLAFYALIGFEDSVTRRGGPGPAARLPARDLRRPADRRPDLHVRLDRRLDGGADGQARGLHGPLLEVVQLGPLAVDTKLFAAIALFALANTILINLITASRLLYGMGEEGVVPSIFRRVHPGRRTPIVAIVFTTGVAMLLIVTGDLEALADTTVTLLLIAFIGVNAAVLGSRRDRVEHDHFHVPSAIPVIGVIVCIGLLTQREAEIFLRSGLLLLGLLLWGVNQLLTRREARSRPAGAATGSSTVTAWT